VFNCVNYSRRRQKKLRDACPTMAARSHSASFSAGCSSRSGISPLGSRQGRCPRNGNARSFPSVSSRSSRYAATPRTANFALLNATAPPADGRSRAGKNDRAGASLKHVGHGFPRTEECAEYGHASGTLELLRGSLFQVPAERTTRVRDKNLHRAESFAHFAKTCRRPVLNRRCPWELRALAPQVQRPICR
jgi:hypothetical protein